MATTSSNESSVRDDLPGALPAADPRRWRALGLLGLLQFMLVLDITIVNVALPRIQTTLGFSQSGLTWVVNGYVLMAGGFLLLGGRLADIFGRRRLLLIGLVVFAVSSAACGAAVNQAMLIAGRFGQGLGEALAAPAALSLIALLFTDSKERTKALGIWGGLTGIGGIMGYIISGLLTTYVSWHWIFYINIPMTIVLLIVVPRLIRESRMAREKEHRLDFTGAIAVTAGLMGVVYGLLQAATRDWSSVHVLLPLIVGVCLLVGTAVHESRAKAPLIPMQFFANRTRTVANIVGVLFMASFIPYSFLLTLFEQHVLHYSPLRTGLSYLPLGLGIGIGIGIGTGLTERVGIRTIAAVGEILAGVGLFITSMISPDSSYATGILPGMLVLGVFAGMTMPTLTNAALYKVTGQDSGLASGVQTTMQQIGSALGLAALVTFATRLTATQLQQGSSPAHAMTSGLVLSLRIGGVLLVISGLLIAFLLEPGVGMEEHQRAPELAAESS